MARCDGHRDVVTGRVSWCDRPVVWRYELAEGDDAGRLSRLLCLECEPVFAESMRLRGIGYSRVWVGAGEAPRPVDPPVSGVRTIRHSNHPKGWVT